MAEADSATTPDMGLIARAVGVITAPGRTFESVVRSPRPAAILLLIAFVVGAAAALPQFTEKGRQATLDMQVRTVERMTGQPMTDQAYQQMAANSQSSIGGIFAFLGTFVSMPLTALFFSALYWAIFNAVLGGTASFKQVLGVITHSMVIMALGAAAALPFQLMAERMTMTGPFHFGALAPGLAEDSFLASFLTAMNVFTLWQIAVIAIGLGVLYRRKPAPIGIALVALYAGLVAVGITIFSSFTGR